MVVEEVDELDESEDVARGEGLGVEALGILVLEAWVVEKASETNDKAGCSLLVPSEH
jgi:hypothetical protein